MRKTWPEKARSFIEEKQKEGIQNGLKGEELRKFVNAAYPWGPRMYYPYKAWLVEMKKVFSDKNLNTGRLEIRRAKSD